ncbi:4672_t:CDS:2 [Funneliformis geosporum]|nr:4672_t:CDS:2 [Funneliformis geosporum]
MLGGVGGSFLIYRNSSNQISNDEDKSFKKEKRPTLPFKDDSNNLPSDPQNPTNHENLPPSDNNKTEIKKRFLIPKNTSILVDKDLWQENLIFTLVYSKNRGKNTKSKEIYFDYSKYNGKDYVFIDNQVQAGKPEQELDKYVFHSDNPSIKKLLAKNHLQQQNRRYEFAFRVFYLERDIEKYDPNTRTYYLNNESRVKNAVQHSEQPLRVLEIGVGCGNIAISLAKTEKFSIIVSNPPYVSSQEYQNLSSVVKTQPIEALLAENDGYFFYQQIFQQARNFLSKKFLLVVEIGHQQAEKVIKLIIEYFPQVEVSIYPDYAYMVTKKSTKKPVVSIVGKAKLAERIYSNKGRILSLNKLQIEAVISEVLEETKKSLLKGETIRFPSYYSLHTVMQKPRVAMNLQTKKKMTIPAKQLNGRAIAFQAIDRGSTPLIRSK